MKAKAPYGSPCNGCGVCCMIELCPLGALTFGRWEGPCPALTDNLLGSHVCGLLTTPSFGPDERAAAAAAIGAGCGCDALHANVDDVDGADAIRPRLLAKAQENFDALNPRAQRILKAWTRAYLPYPGPRP